VPLRDPAKREERAIRREQRKDERATAAFARTPAGQARAAFEAGLELFQVALPLEETVRTVGGFITGDKTTTSRAYAHADVLDEIECEGWLLQHADYVWAQTGAVSRDKFLSSGQTEAITGRIIGVYIFRRERRFGRSREGASHADERNARTRVGLLRHSARLAATASRFHAGSRLLTHAPLFKGAA
jgi:hypothetical protein